MTNNTNSDIVKNLKEIAYGMSILIVEDDILLQEQLKMFLSRFFKHTDVANNGLEALALYEKNQYSLIFTDLTMPFMGGKELAEKIKNINESQHIMVLSAHSESDKLIQLVNIGIDGYSLKPLDFTSVLKQVNKICQAIYNRDMLEHLNIMLEESNSELINKNIELKSTLEELMNAKKTIEKLSTVNNKPPTKNNQLKKEITIVQAKKMSAVEFLNSYPLELESTNESLEELEADFYTLLTTAEKTFDHTALMALTDILHLFAREIEMVPQFGAVAHGILEVEKAFRSVEDHTKIPTVLPMLGSLFDNLEKWRKGIFLYHDAEDIHYMDNSLISDALSLQAFLSSNDSSSDTEMEFF
jgi:DNA-binding response OmpR family regulator